MQTATCKTHTPVLLQPRVAPLSLGGGLFQWLSKPGVFHCNLVCKIRICFRFFSIMLFDPPTRGSKNAFLHYKSFLKSALNGLKFSIYLVHRIKRPTVKKLDQSDCRFNSYGIFLVFWGRFFKNGPKRLKKCRNYWTDSLIELIFSP